LAFSIGYDKIIYYAFVHPHLIYGIEMYGNTLCEIFKQVNDP